MVASTWRVSNSYRQCSSQRAGEFFASFTEMLNENKGFYRTLTPCIMVRILLAQPGSSVSEVNFPQYGEASTFPQVKLADTGLRSATSGSSGIWMRVSGAGLCSLFSNFRFRKRETGSTV